MAIKLYELAGKDTNQRFSPFCWRTKFALAHKGLTVDTDYIQFADKSSIAGFDSNTVPVLVDGDTTIADSFAIAQYLDKTYSDNPLMGSAIAEGQARFIDTWVNTTIYPAIAKMIILDVYNCITESDQAYFRETREARFGVTLEQFSKYDDEQIDVLAKALTPVRMMLNAQPYLSGEAPGYADYILIGTLMWARASSTKTIIKDDDAVMDWVNKMLDMYDGLGRKASLA